MELWGNKRNPLETEKVNLRFSRSISVTLHKHLSVPSAIQESLNKGKLPRLLALTLPMKPSQEATMPGKGRCMVILMMQKVGTCFNRRIANRHIPPSIPDFQKLCCIYQYREQLYSLTFVIR